MDFPFNVWILCFVQLNLNKLLIQTFWPGFAGHNTQGVKYNVLFSSLRYMKFTGTIKANKSFVYMTNISVNNGIIHPPCKCYVFCNFSDSTSISFISFSSQTYRDFFQNIHLTNVSAMINSILGIFFLVVVKELQDKFKDKIKFPLPIELAVVSIVII